MIIKVKKGDNYIVIDESNNKSSSSSVNQASIRWGDQKENVISVLKVMCDEISKL